MKRLFSILCAMILFAGLTTGQASAISYCKDMEPLGDKSWDDEIHIDVGTTLEVDLWINDIPPVISGGLFLIMDSTLGTVTDIVVADGNEQPGQWDAGSTTDKLPAPSFSGATLCQPRVPVQRRGHCPPVAELDHERTAGHSNVSGHCRFICQT